MKVQLFMFKDNIAGTFDFPIVSANLGSAKRQIKSLLLSRRVNPQKPISVLDNLEDKDIYAVATIDTESGVVEPLASPTFIFHLVQLDDEVLSDIANYQARLEKAGIKKEGVVDEVKDTEEKA